MILRVIESPSVAILFIIKPISVIFNDQISLFANILAFPTSKAILEISYVFIAILIESCSFSMHFILWPFPFIFFHLRLSIVCYFSEPMPYLSSECSSINTTTSIFFLKFPDGVVVLKLLKDIFHLLVNNWAIFREKFKDIEKFCVFFFHAI